MAQRRRPAAYGLPGDLGREMPGLGREPGAIAGLRLRGAEDKTSPGEPAPGSSSAKSPWKLRKNPPKPGPCGLLGLAAVGKKQKEIKNSINQRAVGRFAL